MMTLREEHLTQAVATTGSHHIALGIAAAFKGIISVEKPTLGELAEIHAAETAWQDATKALQDYQESQLQ